MRSLCYDLLVASRARGKSSGNLSLSLFSKLSGSTSPQRRSAFSVSHSTQRWSAGHLNEAVSLLKESICNSPGQILTIRLHPSAFSPSNSWGPFAAEEDYPPKSLNGRNLETSHYWPRLPPEYSPSMLFPL